MYSYIQLKSKFEHSTRLNRMEYKIFNNTYAVNQLPHHIDIILHTSKIAEIAQDYIMLNSCNWRTFTTKTRMNSILHDNKIPFTIYQDHNNWFIFDALNPTAVKCEFHDMMKFYKNTAGNWEYI
jgi:hypothetical protein